MSLALFSNPYITGAQATKLRKLAKAYAEAQIKVSRVNEGVYFPDEEKKNQREAERAERQLFKFIDSLKGI